MSDAKIFFFSMVALRKNSCTFVLRCRIPHDNLASFVSKLIRTTAGHVDMECKKDLSEMIVVGKATRAG